MHGLPAARGALPIALICLLLAGLAAVAVLAPPIWVAGALAGLLSLWVIGTWPSLGLLLIILGAQYAPLLSKMLANKVPYYLAVVSPVPVAIAVVWARWRKTSGLASIGWSPLRAPLLLVFGLFCIQLLNPRVPSYGAAVSDLGRLFAPMFVYVALVFADIDERWLKGLLIGLAINAAIAAAYGLSQELIGWLPFEEAWAASIGAHGFVPGAALHRRPPSVTFYSATAALYLASLFWLLQALAVEFRLSGWRKLGLHLISGLAVVAMLLTLTRGIWLAFGATLVLSLSVGLANWWNSDPSRPRLSWRQFLVGLLVAGLVLGAGMAYVINTQAALSRESGGVLERLASVLDVRTYTYSGTAAGSRLSTWATFLSSIDPWGYLVGYGLGNVGAAGARFAGDRSLSQTTVDNWYLTTLLIGGLPTMLCFIWLLWRAVRTGLSLGQRGADRTLAGAGWALACVVVLFGGAFLTGDYMDAYPANLFFWISLGLLDRLAARRAAAAGEPSLQGSSGSPSHARPL